MPGCGAGSDGAPDDDRLRLVDHRARHLQALRRARHPGRDGRLGWGRHRGHAPLRCGLAVSFLQPDPRHARRARRPRGARARPPGRRDRRPRLRRQAPARR